MMKLFASRIRKILFVILLIVTLNFAIEAKAQPFNVVDEWYLHDEISKDYVSISADSRLAVYHDVDGNLYIRDINAHTDQALYDIYGSLNGEGFFLPNNQLLLFTKNSGNAGDLGTYDHIARLLINSQNPGPYGKDSFQDTFDFSSVGCRSFTNDDSNVELHQENRCEISWPVISPDGYRLAVGVIVKDYQNKRTYFTGLLDAAGGNAMPEKIAEGYPPLFWSANSNEIYFYKREPSGNDSLAKFDLQTRQISIVGSRLQLNIHGTIPGTDMIFVENGKFLAVKPAPGSGATVENSKIDPKLVELVSKIPVEDAQGRHIVDVKVAPAGKRLLLVCTGAIGGGAHAWGENIGHVEVISWQ